MAHWSISHRGFHFWQPAVLRWCLESYLWSSLFANAFYISNMRRQVVVHDFIIPCLFHAGSWQLVFVWFYPGIPPLWYWVWIAKCNNPLPEPKKCNSSQWPADCDRNPQPRQTCVFQDFYQRWCSFCPTFTSRNTNQSWGLFRIPVTSWLRKTTRCHSTSQLSVIPSAGPIMACNHPESLFYSWYNLPYRYSSIQL